MSKMPPKRTFFTDFGKNKRFCHFVSRGSFKDIFSLCTNPQITKGCLFFLHSLPCDSPLYLGPVCRGRAGCLLICSLFVINGRAVPSLKAAFGWDTVSFRQNLSLLLMETCAAGYAKWALVFCIFIFSNSIEIMTPTDM